ncbi:MAG: hypothetical protein R3F53_24575 [Gammaproteobacteria bacterium]
MLVVNCNLQRLDGPVRGNGKIIQELERMLLGAGWEVPKAIWGHPDALFVTRYSRARCEQRMDAALMAITRCTRCYPVISSASIRQGKSGIHGTMKLCPTRKWWTIKRGGFDHLEARAYGSKRQTRQTVCDSDQNRFKGYGLGESAEGRNTAHQKKNFSAENAGNQPKVFGIRSAASRPNWAEFYHTGRQPEIRVFTGSPDSAAWLFQLSRSSTCPTLNTPALET